MAGADAVCPGTGEALLMAIAGRRGVVGELSGPGQGKLAGRIGCCGVRFLAGETAAAGVLGT